MSTNKARSEQPFNYQERAKVKKSRFDLSHDVKTSFSMGQLIPFLTLETLPGG